MFENRVLRKIFGPEGKGDWHAVKAYKRSRGITPLIL
jgi:hypothetical protein